MHKLIIFIVPRSGIPPVLWPDPKPVKTGNYFCLLMGNPLPIKSKRAFSREQEKNDNQSQACHYHLQIHRDEHETLGIHSRRCPFPRDGADRCEHTTRTGNFSTINNLRVFIGCCGKGCVKSEMPTAPLTSPVAIYRRFLPSLRHGRNPGIARTRVRFEHSTYQISNRGTTAPHLELNRFPRLPAGSRFTVER